jgi:hypothetical protein
MARLLELNYVRWENEDRSRTVFHDRIFESFPTLTADDIREIKNATERPYWLRAVASLAGEKYWINQDTTVDLEQVLTQVDRLLRQGIHVELANKKGRTEL